MSVLKTRKNDKDVDLFISSIDNDRRRVDSKKLLEIFKEITGEEPVMWGESIIGFGDYHYRYASGREGDWFKVGFSPRVQSITIYLTYGILEMKDLLGRLGKHKTGKACLYVNRLSEIDLEVLEMIISKAYHETDF